MIIITDRPGQLCNRLWAITPFIALSLKHDIRLYVAHFDDYSKYFENLDAFKKIKIGVFKNYYSYRAFINFIELLRIKYLVNNSKITIKLNKIKSFDKLKHTLTRSNTINFINSWHQPYDPQIMADYKNEIKKLFSPRKNVKSDVDKFLNNLKKPGHTLVGVHIRRGDYKIFLNGRFCYTDEIYKNHMNKIKKELHKINKKALFVLCSNKKIDLENYKDFNITIIEDSTPIHDLYALSSSDYIFGPPSTFSMWASYYNDVPLKFIMNKNEEISLSEFSPIIAQNKFKNGQTLSF